MKSKILFVFLILITTGMMISASAKPEKPAYISKEYEIYGTWINSDYDFSSVKAKVIFNPNGKATYYNTETSSISNDNREFYITNKWTDSEGNVWYTFIEYLPGEKFYLLVKISNSGRTMEMAGYPIDYPKEIDPDGMYLYSIRYRE